MIDLILLGGGGHCRSCIDVILTTKEFCIAGIVLRDDDHRKTFMNHPVLGSDKNLNELLSATSRVLVAVGQIKDDKDRRRLYEVAKSRGAAFPVVRSPLAYQSPYSMLGEGTIMMHHAVMNNSSSVGVNCILNTKCLIEHDVTVGDHCHVSTGAILNGGVRVKSGTFIGSGAIVREGVTIGERVTIGAGQVILKDVPDNTTVK